MKIVVLHLLCDKQDLNEISICAEKIGGNISTRVA